MRLSEKESRFLLSSGGHGPVDQARFLLSLGLWEEEYVFFPPHSVAVRQKTF